MAQPTPRPTPTLPHVAAPPADTLHSPAFLGVVVLLGLVTCAFALYILYQSNRNSAARLKERELREGFRRDLAAAAHGYEMRRVAQENEVRLARARMRSSVAIYREASADLAKIDRALAHNRLHSEAAADALRQVANVAAYRLAAIGSDGERPSPRFLEGEEPTPLTSEALNLTP